MLKQARGYSDMEKAAYLLSQISSASMTECPLNILSRILSSLKRLEAKLQVLEVESMLASILTVLPTKD